MYKTQVHLCKGEVNTTNSDSSIDLWHKKLDHMSEKSLQILTKKQLTGIKGVPLNGCVHCLVGKQHRVSFNKRSSQRNENILDLVYSDVCGPIKDKILSGASYFVTFIDDASRKVWAYALKTKYQVLGVFKSFHAMVEGETEKTLKYICTNNGG